MLFAFWTLVGMLIGDMICVAFGMEAETVVWAWMVKLPILLIVMFAVWGQQ